VFPVSVSAGVYRAGKGNGWIIQGKLELVAFGGVAEDALLGELGQAGTQGGGAHAAEFAQLLDGGGLAQLSQCLEDPIHSRDLRVGWRGRDLGEDRQSQGRLALGELEGNVVLRGSGAVFGGEG